MSNPASTTDKILANDDDDRLLAFTSQKIEDLGGGNMGSTADSVDIKTQQFPTLEDDSNNNSSNGVNIPEITMSFSEQSNPQIVAKEGTASSVSSSSAASALKRPAFSPTDSQMLSIVNSYSGSKRRRSSVEAVAAASSVLASFAASAKSQMEAAAAMGISPAQTTTTTTATTTGSAGQQQYATYQPVVNDLSLSMLNAAATTAGNGSNNNIDNTNTVAAAAAAAAASGLNQQPTFDLAAFAALPAHAAFSNATAAVTTSGATAGMGVPIIAPAATTTTTTTVPLGSNNSGIANPGASGRRSSKGSKSKLKVNVDESIPEYDEHNSNDDPTSALSTGMPLTPDAPGSGRPGSLRHLTADERRSRRLQRNRLAAKECRQKKKQYIKDLEDRVEYLENENAKLIKELNELNAKLTLGIMRTGNTPILGNSTPLSGIPKDVCVDPAAAVASALRTTTNNANAAVAAANAAAAAAAETTASITTAATTKATTTNQQEPSDALLFSSMTRNTPSVRNSPTPDPVNLLFAISSSPSSPSVTNKNIKSKGTSNPKTATTPTSQQTNTQTTPTKGPIKTVTRTPTSNSNNRSQISNSESQPQQKLAL